MDDCERDESGRHGKDRHASAPALGSLFPALKIDPNYCFTAYELLCHSALLAGTDLEERAVELHSQFNSGSQRALVTVQAMRETEPHPQVGSSPTASCQQGDPKKARV